MDSNIEIICRNKEEELLDKYFGNSVNAVALEHPETIGEYTLDLPSKIEGEYRQYLVKLWREFSDTPLLLEEQHLKQLMTENAREEITRAYIDAKRITLWERITKTNHEDVAYYKGLLYEYTKDILMIMRIDFLEEITGNHINCKAF